MLARTIAVRALLCAAVFAGSFAIGRAQRPSVAAHEQLAPSLPAAAAGPAIPVRLSTAQRSRAKRPKSLTLPRT